MYQTIHYVASAPSQPASSLSILKIICRFFFVENLHSLVTLAVSDPCSNPCSNPCLGPLQVDATLEVAKTLSERLGRYTQVLLEGCAYAGTGNVLFVQSLLAVVGERIEKVLSALLPAASSRRRPSGSSSPRISASPIRFVLSLNCRPADPTRPVQSTFESTRIPSPF